MAILVTCVVAMLVPHVSLGGVFYVDDDAALGVGGGSSGNPFGLISEAVGAASSSDTVSVRPGLYSEHFSADMHDPMGMNTASVVMEDGVALHSTAGPQSTTIMGMGCETVVKPLGRRTDLDVEWLWWSHF